MNTNMEPRKNPLFSDIECNVDIENHNSFFAILLMRNNDMIKPEDASIFTSELDDNLDFHKFVLYKITKEFFNQVKNNNFYTVVNVDDNLQIFNHFGFQFKTKTIVILHLQNYHFLKIKNLIDSYSNHELLQTIYDNTLLLKSFQLNYSINTIPINRIIETFWLSISNHNITYEFSKRYFKTQILRNDVTNVVTKSVDNHVVDDIINKNNDYFVIEYNNKNIVNINTKNNKFELSNTDYTIDDIEIIFNKINNINDRISFVKKLLLTKDYSHLITKLLFSDKLKKYTPSKVHNFYKELHYSMIIFYFAECIQKGDIDYDYVFDINTASKLPLLPYNSVNSKCNPYMPLLVSDKELNPQNNLWGLPYKVTNGGISNYDCFVSRANIFISGNEKCNIFKNSHDYVNYAVTGSIITACVQRKNLLEEQFNNFKRFLDEYYADSDIDVIIQADDILSFHTNSILLFNIIKQNLNNFHNQECHVTMELEKKIMLYVDDEFLENHLPDITTKYFCENINDIELTNRIVELYQNKINDYYNKIFDEYIQDTKEDEDSEIREIINNTNQTFILKYKYNYSEDVAIQFKNIIKSPFLERDIEMFKGFNDKFFQNIHSFHLPCVRGYWNGDNVYLLPSCVMSHMTFMNIDYYYYFGKYHPVEIINKYRQRGFGTFLNNKEINDYFHILKDIPYWQNLMFINEPAESKEEEKENDYISSNEHLTGHIQLDSIFYQPRYYNQEYFIGENHNPVEYNYNTINNINYNPTITPYINNIIINKTTGSIKYSI